MTTEENKEVPESRGDELPEETTTSPEEIIEAKNEEPEKKEISIPKERFDAAVKKERDAAVAAETRARELEAQLNANKLMIDVEKLGEEIDALEEELDKVLADDNAPSEKKRIRKEIRNRQEAIAEARAEQRSRYATAVAVEQIRYDALLDRLEVDHPEINPDHESYSEEILADVIDLKTAYEAKGLSSSEALRKASGFVFKALKEVEKPKEEPEKKPDADAEAKRKEAAIKKGLEARKGQPAASKNAGVSSEKLGGTVTKETVAKMSDKDFDKLTAEELAQLRGDGG